MNVYGEVEDVKVILMLKDEPVLVIENYSCKIIDYNRLPISLRYHHVSFDDVMHIMSL
jgi:hypothetical protein